ncbi:PhoD-like phosphatase-domain-containing protein [Paraphysoderma sedebokerense]|nr:PhoD-like phosphatase-domain-containing protein [Paraphysoderma sedebokerense]
MGFQETQNALKLPSYFTYDDHEVLNNWDRGVTGPYENAVRAFNDYLGSTNPVPYQPGHSYYNFTYGDSDFFMTDIRRYRSKSSIKDDSDKTMLGLRQKQDLKDWLLRTKENKGFKFLLTGVPMTLNWQCDYDTWSSYITERNEILDFIHENNIKRVLVLSADRHAIGIQLLPYSIPEFSISPINQFPAPFQFYSSDPPEKVLYHDRSSFVNVGLMRINTTGTRGAELIFELWDLDGLAVGSFM